MRRYVHEHVPRRLLENLVTLSLCLFLGVLAWGFKEVTDLGRENRARINESRAASVRVCRDINEIRSEIRAVLQDFKSAPIKGLSPSDQLRRYDRLTQAQVRLADKRCVHARRRQ